MIAVFEKPHFPLPASLPNCSFPIVIKPDPANRDDYRSLRFSVFWVASREVVIQKYLEGPSFSSEMGQPMEKREERLLEFGSLVAKGVGLTYFYFESEESEVYCTTVDLVSGVSSVEIGSSAMGP